MNDMANRIKRLRKREAISQEEFGKIVGVTQQYVGALEAGTRWPSPALIMLIGLKFGVAEEWLTSGKGGLPKGAALPV